MEGFRGMDKKRLREKDEEGNRENYWPKHFACTHFFFP